jgi:O-antigen/teichoic acid export membrane protein
VVLFDERWRENIFIIVSLGSALQYVRCSLSRGAEGIAKQRMGRKKLFTQSFAAGQVFMLTNVVYSLVSVPLALSYLSLKEFGLWAVVMQVAGFLLLLDAGFSSGAGRLLIDVKDNRPSKAYGRIILSTFLMLLCGAIFAVLAGITIAGSLVSWMRISPELTVSANTLLIGQICIAALTLPSRVIGGCLVAHGRIDLLNVAFSVSLLIGLSAMGIALAAGAGLYALLWANAAAATYTIAATLVYSHNRKYLPRYTELGLPRWRDVSNVLRLSGNIFLNQIGHMILNVSQAILLGRFAGLESVGIWSVGSKLYNLILQAADKVIQSAGPLCSEMWARSEMFRFNFRMQQLKVLTWLACSLGAACLIAFNSPFISIWTSDKVVWDKGFNYLLALLFVLRSFSNMESIPIVASKVYKMYRFIPLCEAALFIGAAAILIPIMGIAGLLIAALLAVCVITMPYVIYCEYSRVGGENYSRALGFCAVALGCMPSIVAWWITSQLTDRVDLWIRLPVTTAMVLLSCVPIGWMTARRILTSRDPF